MNVDSVIRDAATRIEASLDDWRFGRNASPTELDHVITCYESMGLDWREDKIHTEAISADLEANAAENIGSSTELAAYVIAEIRAGQREIASYAGEESSSTRRHRRGFAWGWRTPHGQRFYGVDFGPFALGILLNG